MFPILKKIVSKLHKSNNLETILNINMYLSYEDITMEKL